MKQGFCDYCNDLVDYEIKKIHKISEIHGKKYEYDGFEGTCKKCGQIISSNEIIDKNLEILNRVYRKQENIITVDEINQILIKYKIGKKPLAKLLGWGEITLIRYLNGDTPSKNYSDQLFLILNDINYMNQLLEKNKEYISEKAYSNVKKSIELIKRNQYKSDSSNAIELISEYIILESKEVTPLALQKLLYYAQGFYNVFFGKFLFEEDCEAWVHGPVYVSIYEKYKDFKSDIISISVDYDVRDMITDDKREILDAVINFFGYYNGKALEKMSHYETPWINARKGLFPTDTSNEIIKHEDIRDYFVKIKEKYDMINVLDIRKYSEDQFKRVLEV